MAEVLNKESVHAQCSNIGFADVQRLPGNCSSYQTIQEETKFFLQLSCDNKCLEIPMRGGLRNSAEAVRSSTTEAGNRRVRKE